MFITFEGPDGSGKTTQLKKLSAFLQKRGYKIVSTREPGGTSIGDQIRHLLFSMKNTGMHPRTEILLFQASRAQHVEELIKPSIESGAIVLCDRYADSTIAYQGYGHRIDLQQLHTIVNFATSGLTPGLTILLDIDAEEGLKRRNKDGGWNRMEAYELAFHRRVREGYKELIKQNPSRWVVIDGTLPIEQVEKRIRKAVLAFIDKQSG